MWGLCIISARTVRLIRFRIEAYKPHTEQSVVRHDPYTIEKIIMPGEGVGECFPLHLMSEDMAEQKKIQTIYL